MPTLRIAEPFPAAELGNSTADPRGHARALTQAVGVLTDLALLGLGAAAAFWLCALVPASAGGRGSLQTSAGWLLLFSVLAVLFAHAQKLYREVQLRSSRQETAAVVKAVVMAAAVLAASLCLSRAPAVSHLTLGCAALLGSSTVAAWRYVRRRRLARARRAQGARNVLLVGDSRAAAALEQHLAENPALGYVVKGWLEGGARKVAQPDGRCLGSLGRLSQIVRAHFIDEILVVLPEERERVKAVVWEARRCGVGARIIPDFYDGLAWGAPVEYLGLFPAVEVYQPARPVLGLILKRCLDVAGSALALLLSAPLLLLLAAAVRLDSPGPALYRSPRIGRKGRSFTCYKFRTMVVNAEALRDRLRHLNERRGVLFKIAKDPRLTRVGRILRKYSLDELPQFWNVLQGDMSLVGPRPPLPGEYRQYELDHLKRLEVLPGITGLWQVEARGDPSFESYIRLDTHYVDHWSLWLDCKILLRTVGAVASGTGQ